MKSIHACFPLFLACSFALWACAGPGLMQTPAPPTGTPAEATSTPTEAPTQTPITMNDGRGRQLTLSQPAARIVSLAPSNTEILFAVDAGNQLVGRDEFSDYPEQAQAIASIGSTYGELNTEAIVGLQPDLVLAAGITPPEQLQALEDVGLPVFVIGNPEDFGDLFDNLLTVGVLTGHADEASELVAKLQARYADVTAAVAGVEPVKLFYEIDGSDPTAPWSTGSGTFQQQIFELAGGDNIASDIEGWGQLSIEEIVVRDPQVIIFAGGPFVPTTVDSLKARAGWAEIGAIQADRVYEIDTDLLDLPGPRLVEGLDRVAHILHPERFGE